MNPAYPVSSTLLRRLTLLALVSTAFVSQIPAAQAQAQAQALPAAKPEAVGMSAERLNRIGDFLRAEVAQKRIPGASVMVVRGGKVAYVETVGQRGPDNAAPMKSDDIFRIYSMTKPIVSVAAMMLVEDGKLLLEAPVARYIPSFANVKVGVEKTDAQGFKSLELVAPRSHRSESPVRPSWWCGAAK